ncbi:MAG TPA: hypothetical protein VFO70_02250 [Chitinophagaceae bacterium]|jgi:hypothetical protein|nr:hypothetical protein [Chitinophagaceae bacterium]
MDKDNLTRDEQLRVENDFLKMKIMLEKGASFHSDDRDNMLSPELENQFLNNILEFERQYEQRKVIKVFDKICRPAHFRPVADIGEGEIEAAWEELEKYMGDYGVSLDACSPNISKRELYRFATEELFNYEMADMNMPGMISGFIYDEFYPDPIYDNTRLVVDYCMEMILRKRPFECQYGFRDDNLRLNGNHPLNREQFEHLVNSFKNAYDHFETAEISEVECHIDGKECNVKGVYAVTVRIPNESIVLAGNWLAELTLDEEMDYWNIYNVQVEGVNF